MGAVAQPNAGLPSIDFPPLMPAGRPLDILMTPLELGPSQRLLGVIGFLDATALHTAIGPQRRRRDQATAEPGTRGRHRRSQRQRTGGARQPMSGTRGGRRTCVVAFLVVTPNRNARHCPPLPLSQEKNAVLLGECAFAFSPPRLGLCRLGTLPQTWGDLQPQHRIGPMGV